MRWFYDNKIDTVAYVLTANSENANYPLTNIRDYQLTKHYRSTGDTSEWVKIDAGSGLTITATFAFIAGHNISASATVIKIQGNATDVWTSPTVNESFTHSTGLMWKAFSSQALRYWRFLIEDASNPDTYIKFGRLGVGVYFDLTNWAQADFEPRPIDTSVLDRSVTGQIYGDERIIYNEYDYFFPYLDNTEKTNMLTMWETNKKARPIVLIPNPSDTTLPPFYGNILDFRYQHRVAWTWRAWMTISEGL